MNFHTFTISIVYFFTIIIVHIVLKNNNNLERDYNNYEESDYETDYSDNEMVLDIDAIDNLRQQTIERTKGKDNIQNISQEESEDIKNELLKYLDIEKIESEDIKNELIEKNQSSEINDLKNESPEKTLDENVLAYDDLDTSYASFS
jgi:hypothetical protein